MSNWDFKFVYNTEEDFNKDLEEAEKGVSSIVKYKGKLNNKKVFLEYIKESEVFSKVIDKLYFYSHSLGDLALNDTHISELKDKVFSLYMKADQLSSFVIPEILSLTKEVVFSFLEGSEYTDYKVVYEKLFHNQEHVLSEKEESILSRYSFLHNEYSQMYQSLAILDPKNDEATLESGEKVIVTQSNYRSLLPKQSNPKDRQSIFKAAYTRYVENKNAFATLYSQVLKTNHASALARGFNEALDAKLFAQNTPKEVFLNLIEVARDAHPYIKEYINLRKKALNLETYHTYDRFLSIKEIDKSYTYEEAKQIVIDAFKDEDQELRTNVIKALEDNYVDSNPAPYKRTGAYSNSIYGYHPIILLNHDNTLDSIFTVAHEAGHSSHSIFSGSNQSYALASYEIFVAEIASTFNEHLLLDYLIANSKNKDEKIVLIENAIDMIMSTFFRQTLFANFEYEANKLLKNNQIINEQTLSQIMIDLYKHYYDIDITKEDGKQYVWAYIPHLYYTPYYVYQYSTSFAASLQIYANVRKNKEKGYENFKKLLKAGGSDYPINIVKNAGVDLTKKESYNAVVDRFKSLTKQLKELLGE